jgi:hypothetical protein
MCINCVHWIVDYFLFTFSSNPSKMQHQVCSILEVETILCEALEGQKHMLLQVSC